MNNLFRPIFFLVVNVALVLGCATYVCADAVVDARNVVRIREKMKGIMLASLEYRKASIVDVINDLGNLSRELDTSTISEQDKGINFLLALEDSDDFWSIGSVEDIPLVSIKARYVTLLDALDLIMEMTKLDYTVEGNLVMIVRKSASPSHGDRTVPTSAAHPLLSARSLKVVKSFDPKVLRKPESGRWFYYVPGTAKMRERPVEYSKRGFKKEPKGTHVVLLFDPESETIYWKWIAAPPSIFFADRDRVNLGEICFGLDPLVEDLWVKHHPEWDHRYKLSSQLLSEEVGGGDVTLLEKAMDWIQDNWVDRETPEFLRLKATLDSQTNRLNRIDAQLDREQAEAEQLRRELHQLESYGGKPRYEKMKMAKERLSRQEQRIRMLERDREEVVKNAKTTLEKMRTIGIRYEKAQDRNALEAYVRKMEFTVSVVSKGEDKR